MPSPPPVTIVFPVYQCASRAAALVEGVLRQRHPEHTAQGDWLEILFIDNASTDGTAEALKRELEKAGSPAHARVIANPQNLGTVGSLNKALKTVRGPYAVVCHQDCRFGRDDYLSGMLTLMEQDPRAGVISGRPAVEPGTTLPFYDKVALVMSQMELFGHCDIFRMTALHAAGYFDVKGGLPRRLREKGYELHHAPQLVYYVDSSGRRSGAIERLLERQRRLALVHPLGAAASTGWTRMLRSLLRASQLGSAAAYALVLLALLFGAPFGPCLAALAVVFAGKTLLFWRYLYAVRVKPDELAAFYALQPAMDLWYAWGFVQGIRGRIQAGRGPSGHAT